MRAVAIATGSAKAVVGGAIDPQVGVVHEVGVVREVGVVHEIAHERWVPGRCGQYVSCLHRSRPKTYPSADHFPRTLYWE